MSRMIDESRKYKKTRHRNNKKCSFLKRLLKNTLHKDQKTTPSPSMVQCDKTEDSTTNNNNPLTMLLNPVSDYNNTGTNESLHECECECEHGHEHEARKLFNWLYTGELTALLPNRSWSIHYIEIPMKCVIISEMRIRCEIETGFIPVHTKQIVFDEKMDYKLFFLNAKAPMTTKPRIVRTLTDLVYVIAFVDNIKLCSGGPETILHANVNPECAYRDPQGRWRHNLCTLEVTDSDICELCVSLTEILQRNVRRSRILKKT